MPDTLALAQNAEKIAVGKRCGRHSTAQRFINKRLIDAARKFTTVVRLKGGDPMLFGRAQEEIDALRSAASSTKSCRASPPRLRRAPTSGISLTRRGISRSVDVRDAARRRRRGRRPIGSASVATADTAAIYMARGAGG